jgi:hypothetical protein
MDDHVVPQLDVQDEARLEVQAEARFVPKVIAQGPGAQQHALDDAQCLDALEDVNAQCLDAQCLDAQQDAQTHMTLQCAQTMRPLFEALRTLLMHRLYQLDVLPVCSNGTDQVH